MDNNVKVSYVCDAYFTFATKHETVFSQCFFSILTGSVDLQSSGDS